MGPNPVKVFHVPEHDDDNMSGYHSDDHPFYYLPERREAYIGPYSYFHHDVDWEKGGLDWRGRAGWATPGRINSKGHAIWYDPRDCDPKHRERVTDAMGKSMGAGGGTDITSDYDDDDWEDEAPRSLSDIDLGDIPVTSMVKTAERDFAHWWNLEKPHRKYNATKMAEYAALSKTTRAEAKEFIESHKDDVEGDFDDFRNAFFHKFDRINKEGHWGDDHVTAKWVHVSVAEILHAPGNIMGARHSDDHPYIYNAESGKLYCGDKGAFHVDVQGHPDLQAANEQEPKSVHYFPWIRGRYNQERNEVSHFGVPGYGIDEEHELEPHHRAVEEALGLTRTSNIGGRMSNILDPVHDTLDPRVWDDEGAPAPRLKGHLAKWLRREIYKQAEHFHPDPAKWLRLVLTGSLTTYQYSDQSDVDISLFISPHFLPEWDRGQLIGLMVKNLDGKLVPGTPFPLQCFVVPKNISAADLYQPGLRSGYDIEQTAWLVPPDRSRTHDVERERNSDWVYALESADKMERLLRYDPERAIEFWHQIHRRRRRDQAGGKGDFSQANIVYKMLANRDLFPKLSDASGEYIASRT